MIISQLFQKKNYIMLATKGLCKKFQGSFNQGNVVLGETAQIRCACMALVAISY